jgi:tRNA A-37 threonylcarbamoyl transferase component Bud32
MNVPRPTTIHRRSLTRVALYDASLPDDLVEWLWMQPESLIAAGETLQAKGVRTTVRLVWTAGTYVVKHYVEPTRRHAIKQLVLRSRARRTWNVTRRLADAGIATPRPVACIENRIGPLRRDSYVVYPYVEGRTLRSFLSPTAYDSRATIENLWQQLRDLWHQLGDLRASLADANVGTYVVDVHGRLWVIDLDKASFYRSAKSAALHQERTWKRLLRSSRIAAGELKKAA